MSAPNVSGILAPLETASGSIIGVHTAGILQMLPVAKHTRPISINAIAGSHAALMYGPATSIR